MVVAFGRFPSILKGEDSETDRMSNLENGGRVKQYRYILTERYYGLKGHLLRFCRLDNQNLPESQQGMEYLNPMPRSQR